MTPHQAASRSLAPASLATFSSSLGRRAALTRIGAIGAALYLPGCGRSSPPAEKTSQRQDANGESWQTTVALNWYPDSQHAGFYAATSSEQLANARVGLRVLPGGPAVPVIQSVVTQRVEWGIANADQILMARSNGAPIVALFAAMQDSPRCIMLHRDRKIENWSELRDVTLAVGAGQSFAKFLEKHLPLDGVRIVPYTGNLTLFLNDHQFAQQAYLFSEPFVAKQQGADPVCLRLSELGFNPYTSVLFTHEKVLETRRPEVQAVVSAVQQGWQDYFANPEPIHSQITAANPKMDRESLRFGLEVLQPLCLAGGLTPDKIGTMSLDRWSQLHRTLVELELARADLSPQSAFTTEFLAPPTKTLSSG